MQNNVFLQPAGQIAGIGGWRVDLATSVVEWSDKTCQIHDVPLSYRPTLEEALNFYTPEARPLVTPQLKGALRRGSHGKLSFLW